ncbi:MAG TPA: signal peptidase I [Polyangia bacterium]|nr:signal peptidase I [Polyangia bacterium]
MGWWRERGAWSRARAEGKHLSKEARRVLRKKSFRIPEATAALVSAQADNVDEALRGNDLEQVRRAIGALDDTMNEHLAFARKSTMREYAESIGVAVAIALLLRAFVVEAFQIPSGSMIPTLEVGDHIFVSKFAYGLGIPFTNMKVLQYAEPKRGDIIVFKYPLEQSTDYIKRVVGLPGDVLEMRQGELYINGTIVPREQVPGECHYSESGRASIDDRECERWIETLDGRKHQTIQEPMRGSRDFERKVIPAGHVFVMGDNRDNSSDSRVWGTVDRDLIKGRALIVWWSRGTAENSDSFFGSIGNWFKSIRWKRFFQAVR